MGGGKHVRKSKLTKIDTDVYWAEIDGQPVEKVDLQKSREVAVEDNIVRRRSRLTDGYKQRSARINPKTDGMLPTGIQIYRLWFRFLKLALELEKLGVTKIITKQGVFDRSKGSNIGSKSTDRKTDPFFRTKLWEPIKISKERYAKWDLDQVLDDPFDKWWQTHAFLFEGYAPTFIHPGNNLNPEFLNIRIDPATRLEDITAFIRDQVQPKLTKKRMFKVDGYPRPHVLQNAYNALVLTLKGWSPKDICESNKIYLRATDMRSKGDRLKVTTDKTGKPLYSILVTQNREKGIHQLLEVMKGRFGSAG